MSAPLREDIELRALWTRLRPHALWIALGALAAGAGGHLRAEAQPRVYEAGAGLMSVSPTLGGDLTVSAPPVTPAALEQVLHGAALRADILARLAASPLPQGVRAPLAAELRADLRSGRERHLLLRARVDQQQRGVYEVIARAATPQAAQVLAGATAGALLDWDAGRARTRYSAARARVERGLRTLAARPGGLPAPQRDAALRDLWQLRLLEATATGTLTAVAAPVAPRTPLSPRPARDAALAALLGLLAGAALTLGAQRGRRRLRGAGDLQGLEITMLGELPLPSGGRRAAVGGRAVQAAVREAPLQGALSLLRLQLLPALTRAGSPAVALCALRDGPAGSLVVAALAAHLGASGLRVLIVDAQPLAGRQRRLWPVHVAPWHPLPGAGVDLAAGVATTVAQACLNPHLAQAARVTPQIDLLPADRADPGTPLPLNPVHQAEFPDLLRRWGEAYDAVLIDAPPLCAGPDALAAADAGAGLLLVADSAGDRLSDLQAALSSAAQVQARLLGAVLTHPAPPPRPRTPAPDAAARPEAPRRAAEQRAASRRP